VRHLWCPVGLSDKLGRRGAGAPQSCGAGLLSNFSLDAYLARIDCERPVAPDLTSLRRLHAAHVRAIPFEGIDPLVGAPVSLDAASVWRKLVESRRGGYCFEQNALFKTALEAIGFKTTGLGARVRWMSPPDSPLGPREHMLIKVDLPEGPFLADLGFGACLIDEPLPLATGREHRTEMGAFRLDAYNGNYWLNAKQPGGWRVMYAFDLEPQIAADYELGNWYTATNPRAPLSVFSSSNVSAPTGVINWSTPATLSRRATASRSR
jgi:N-hydroxyarylamine O-acetyltransferase